MSSSTSSSSNFRRPKAGFGGATLGTAFEEAPSSESASFEDEVRKKREERNVRESVRALG